MTQVGIGLFHAPPPAGGTHDSQFRAVLYALVKVVKISHFFVEFSVVKKKSIAGSWAELSVQGGTEGKALSSWK